ncbi:MAG: SusC/RagA family TonB-linked outer membrane protein [Bacteroidales bacterium]|nr:SusC/RagA family TonB-linked outer membrane protein [Bacteroidales bacterium]
MVLLALSIAASAQNITVKGNVKDSNGEAIVGANVLLRGSRTVYTMTDVNGAFSLNVPSNGILQVNCMGYYDQEVPVQGRSNIDIILTDDAQLIDETIVVAYGTATKSSFTGSAAVVDSEVISKKLSSKVTSALSGTTPGVQVISASGDPTSGTPTIRIRGIGSMSASSSPLIIVDGAPFEGAISDINPQDVDNMSVLKDAAATAIYGHRGANGVILITTKKGKSGEATVRFDARFGSNSRLIPQYDVITDPVQYYETYYKLMYNNYFYSGHTVAESYAYADNNLFNENNGGLGYQVYTVPAGQKLIGTNFKMNPNATLGYSDGTYYYQPDNWYNETFHNSFRQEYNVSASGSGERFNYYAGLGYLNDGGIVYNSGYQRFSARLNAEYQIKDWIRFITNMSYSYSDSNNVSSGSWGSSGNAFYIANNIGPIYPLYVRKVDENGDPYLYTEQGRQIYDFGQTGFKRPNFVGNAVRDLYNDVKKSYADVLVGKWGLVLTPFKFLTLNANVGLTDDNTRYNYLYSQFGSASGVDGQAAVGHSRMFALNQQYLAEVKFDIADRHHFDIIAGYEQYRRKSQYIDGSNDHLFNPFVGELDNADGTESIAVSSSSTSYMTEGFLTRVQYDDNNTFFVSASYRRDASSRFAPGHRWGNFGSVGAAWLISKEDWFNASAVNMLKFKISYGVLGNDSLGSNFPYSDQYSHSFDGTDYSISMTYKGNENLTWETSRSFNTGFDFELFNGRLNGTIEYFNRNTTDLLYSKSVPLSAGNPTGTMPVNVGTIRNNGVEVSLDGAIINTRNVQWNWNVNLSHYKNTILALDDSVDPEKGLRGSYFIYKVGGSLYDAYMYKYAGVDKETGQALYWQHVDEVKDAAGNVTEKAYDKTTAVFSDATKYELGSVLPKLFGGFGTSLNAFGIDFSIQCSFQLGGRYYDGNYQQLMWTQASAGQAWHKDILKAWTPENTDTDVPRMDGDTQVAQSAVDRFFVSSDYLSINNVTLGYTFPTSWTKKIKIASLRLYVAGENLAVFSARQGLDPRNNYGLINYTSEAGSSSYSAMRTITGGITLTF